MVRRTLLAVLLSAFVSPAFSSPVTHDLEKLVAEPAGSHGAPMNLGPFMRESYAFELSPIATFTVSELFDFESGVIPDASPVIVPPGFSIFDPSGSR